MSNICDVDRSTIFKWYIVIILTHIYEASPMPIRFDIDSFKKLTGYDKIEEDEENLITFFGTIDFLNREGYVRCSSPYVIHGNSPEPIIQTHIPVFISEKGIKHLESNLGKEKLIDKFKETSKSIVGKVALQLSSTTISTTITELVHHFLR